MMKAGRGAELGDAVPVPGLPNAESQIAIPLLIGDELIGVFSIESAVPQTFDEHDRGLVLDCRQPDRQRDPQRPAVRGAPPRRRGAQGRQCIARGARRGTDRGARARAARRSGTPERRPQPRRRPASRRQRRRPGVAGRRGPRSRPVDPLLLVGPPGAGKEAVAHALHTASRRPGAFIFVSCPELRTTAARRIADGADRPARRVLAGKLELAAGGTLFLESVHELPAEFHQAIIQRLDDHERRAATDERVSPNVRVIASTTMEIGALQGVPARRGAAPPTESPADALLRRLAARHIRVPSLADRREDFRRSSGTSCRGWRGSSARPSTASRRNRWTAWQAYAWPGNIRELRSVLERAVLVSRSTRARHRRGAARRAARGRKLPAGVAPRLRRHGRGLAGPPSPARPSGGREADPARSAAGQRARSTRPPVPARGAGDRGAALAAHRAALRLRRERQRQLLLRDGVARRARSQPDRDALRPAAGRTRRRCSCARRAGRSPRRTISGSCTAISSPRTCSSRAWDRSTTTSRCSTSASSRIGPDRKRCCSRRRGWCPARRHSWRRRLRAGETEVDGRADLYSLACVAYWALTGQLVFAAKTPEQMLLHHARTTPAPPSQMSELPIPRAIDEIVIRCLAKSPDDRPASALDLEAALSEVAFDRPWTQERARAWWELHGPGIGG